MVDSFTEPARSVKLHRLPGAAAGRVVQTMPIGLVEKMERRALLGTKPTNATQAGPCSALQTDPARKSGFGAGRFEVQSPAGTIENSPAIYRWERRPQRPQSRRDERSLSFVGTRSVVPTGLRLFPAGDPSDESLGYFLSSFGRVTSIRRRVQKLICAH